MIDKIQSHQNLESEAIYILCSAMVDSLGKKKTKALRYT